MLTSSAVSFSFISSSEKWCAPAIQETWKALLEKSDNITKLYQSPQWFYHLFETEDNPNLLLGVLRNELGNSEGIVPIKISLNYLKFDIKAYSLFKIPLRTAFILGSLPLLAQEESFYDCLFFALWQSLQSCDCIYMDSVPLKSFLWQYLENSKVIRDYYIIYVPDGSRPHHSLLIPANFNEYLSNFDRKNRAELKRRLRIFQNNSNGTFNLLRIESEDQIKAFLKSAVTVSRNSWQQKRLGVRIDNSHQVQEKLSDLAGRGLLRSYLLMSGKNPCAFRLGYQFNDIYLSAETGYDQTYSSFSPGKVLTLLMIEDFTIYNKPRLLDFGIGHANWKKELSNIHDIDASVYHFRKTIRNKIFRGGHRTLRFSAHFIKKMFVK
jgi:hypothetical protein